MLKNYGVKGLPRQRKDVLLVAKLPMLLVADAETTRGTRNVKIIKCLVKFAGIGLSFAVPRVFSRVGFRLTLRKTLATEKASRNTATDENPSRAFAKFGAPALSPHAFQTRQKRQSVVALYGAHILRGKARAVQSVHYGSHRPIRKVRSK